MAAALLAIPALIAIEGATPEPVIATEALDLQSGVPYAGAEEPTLDVYRPAGASHRPAVVVVHGGGWIGFSRERTEDIARALAQHYASWTPALDGGARRRVRTMGSIETGIATEWVGREIERRPRRPIQLVAQLGGERTKGDARAGAVEIRRGQVDVSRVTVVAPRVER